MKKKRIVNIKRLQQTRSMLQIWALLTLPNYKSIPKNIIYLFLFKMIIYRCNSLIVVAKQESCTTGLLYHVLDQW